MDRMLKCYVHDVVLCSPCFHFARLQRMLHLFRPRGLHRGLLFRSACNPVRPRGQGVRVAGSGPAAASADSTHRDHGRAVSGWRAPAGRPRHQREASPAPAEPALLASEPRPRRSVCCQFLFRNLRRRPASRVPPRPPGRMRCGPRCGRGHAAPLKTLRLLRPAHRPPLTSELILPFGLGLWNVPWCRRPSRPPPSSHG